MIRTIIFISLSILFIAVSWRTLFNIRSHGFYRFFSWECIAWLIATNYKYWFLNPFSLPQVISWILLIISGYLVIHGVILILKSGKPSRHRKEETLYQFEKTTELVEIGIYKYIRHPIYSSLIFLTWGILFKHFTWELMPFALLSTGFLFVTAVFDEKECTVYFGEIYTQYMKGTKRFIPFLI